MYLCKSAKHSKGFVAYCMYTMTKNLPRLQMEAKRAVMAAMGTWPMKLELGWGMLGD